MLGSRLRPRMQKAQKICHTSVRRLAGCRQRSIWRSIIVCKTQSSLASTTRGGAKKQIDGQGVTKGPPAQSNGSQFYAFITGFPFPLGPAFQRKTCRYEVS